ncbi:MAG: 5'-nucleotidase C-terminal domain-containing protein [Fluviicola sp.]|nr:5'-nucleotidase C-terminal domain-containing protein [Fluviicola sp.]
MGNRRSFIRNISAVSVGALIGKVSFASKEKENIENNDFLLEESKQATIQTITILQTTDVHCQNHLHDELFWENGKSVFRKTGGYGRLATYLKNFKKKNKNVFTIDTGDMFQGSELSVETTGDAFVPILNAIDYDLYLPGNWEVIYGKRKMQNLLGRLNAPKVCANMYHDLGEGKRGELIFQPYYTWHVAGIKIGFLGYTDHLVPLRQSPVYSKGILYTHPEENLAHYVDVLKNQENCAFVAIIGHLGLSQQIALANNDACAGVDYILGGDTHERVRVPIQCKHAKVVEPGAFGSFVGKLQLTVENGKVIKDEYELVEINESIKPDKAIESIIFDSEAAFLPKMNEIIGYSTIPLYRYFVVENPIDTMILNALHWKFPEIDIVLSNGFRFCPPRVSKDSTGNIPITNSFIFDMLPVDSTARMGKVTGQQITNWMEKELNNVFASDAGKRFGGWVVKFKGIQVRFNAFGEEGKRVQSITFKGEPLDLNRDYSILACEREGDPEDMLCRMRKVKEAKNTSSTLHTIMREYLKANSPITPTPENNAIILDASPELLSQVHGVAYEFK